MSAVGSVFCLPCWLFLYENLVRAQRNLQGACSMFYLQIREFQLVGAWRMLFSLMLRLITGRPVCSFCLSMCIVRVTAENASQVRAQLRSVVLLL